MSAARAILQPILPDPPEPPGPIGLIAAAGRLPVLVAQGMKAEGHTVHAIGFIGQYMPELPSLCDTFREVSVLRLGSWSKLLRARGVPLAEARSMLIRAFVGEIADRFPDAPVREWAMDRIGAWLATASPPVAIA